MLTILEKEIKYTIISNYYNNIQIYSANNSKLKIKDILTKKKKKKSGKGYKIINWLGVIH